MALRSLEVADPSVGLELALDEFQETLQDVSFADLEERQDALLAFKDTSKTLLEAFLKSLSQQVGFRHEGVLRLASLFDLIQPWNAQPEVSTLNRAPSTLFGVLKATLVAGHSICGDLVTVIAKLDQLSQRTSKINGEELELIAEEAVQGMLVQLASFVVQTCTKILRLSSRAEIRALEPSIYNVDQICRDFEKEVKVARKAGWEKERAKEQKRAADEEKTRTVKAWIDALVDVDMQHKHDSIASTRVANTGVAFVEEVQTWLKAKDVPVFLAHGSPGIGKTYLACAVISQHFEKPLEEVDGMAYIYFTYDDRDRQTPFALYAGIISQLLGTSNKLKEEIFRLFEEQSKLARKQTWQILKSFKQAVIGLKASKLLIIDALDEASQETRDEIFDLLDGIRSSSPRILITSRSDYRESVSHEHVQRYRVYALADDIRTFSEDKLKSRNVQRILKAKYGRGVEAQRFASNISEEILTNSHGLFLHAYYATKDVCDQVDINGIRKAASKQHKDANDIYMLTLSQISDLPTTKRDLAHRIIAWLTFAKKPFEENELKEAFAIDNENGRVDNASHFHAENVVEYCRGLIIRVKTRGVSYLRLAHMTAQEYFLQVEFLQEYHSDICLTCFNHVISCLPLERSKSLEHAGHSIHRRETDYQADHESDDVTSEYTLDSPANEGSEGPNFSDAEDGDPGKYGGGNSEDDDGDAVDGSLVDQVDSLVIFEDRQSWRFGNDVWPRTLLPWIAKKTPFSSYAASYALSHLKDSNINPQIEKRILVFIKTAFSRKRRSTFSQKFQDHPFRMNMLHMSSFIGLPSVIKEVLEMPMIHVDDKDILGRTALMWALGLGKETFAMKLLEEGAQVQDRDRRQRSTLMYASAVKDEVLLSKLLQRVPKIEIDAGFLSSCAMANNAYVMDQMLPSANIDLDQFDENGRAPIHEAVISNSEAAVHSLIEHRAKISLLDRDGYTPLMHAAEGQNSNLVSILIRAGASPDPRNPDGETPLHMAAQNAKAGLGMIQILLRANANILSEDEDGLVPLQSLLRVCRDQNWSEKETLARVKLLSEDPKTISHQSREGANALHDAAQFSNLLVLKYLVSRASSSTVNTQRVSGQTPIFDALYAYNVPAFNFLVEQPEIDLLTLRYDKKTLLNCAAWANQITVVQKLIQKAPELIKKAELHSISAIHYAVERDNLAMFNLLLEAGSDPRSRRHKHDIDLISYAAFEGRISFLDILLKLKAKVWMISDSSGRQVAHRDDRGRTLIHNAAAGGSTSALRKVLSFSPLEGLSLDDRDALGQTPLHCAVRARDEGLVSLLLKAGADKDAIMSSGETSLDLALELEVNDIVCTLVLANARVRGDWRSKLASINCYQTEDFFTKLLDLIAKPISMKRSDVLTDTEPFKEKSVHRIGNEKSVYDSWSFDVPFLEITVPENAALPVRQVIFETISHDQGWSSEPDQWKGTYEHSHTFFEAGVLSMWEMISDAEQTSSSRIRVQTNIHADFKFRRHVNTFDWEHLNQERREWIRALRPGQRIQLYAVARYPGWQNFVQKVKMTVHYYEKAQGEDGRNISARELKDLTKSQRTHGKNSGENNAFHQPKVVIYHQSLHSESGILTSLRPLAREETGIRAVILGKFQLRFNHKETDFQTHEIGAISHPALDLNEYNVDDSSIEDIWDDIEYLQHENIKVLGMLAMRGDHNAWGGSTFEHSYKLLHELVVSRKLDGIDLNLDAYLAETQEGNKAKEKKRASIEDVIRLIDSLHADFGSDFLITMTTSAKALLDSGENQPGENGFEYRALELQRGEFISWYNVRIFTVDHNLQGIDRHAEVLNKSAPIFVNELSSLIRLLDQDTIYSPHKILIAISTSPANSKSHMATKYSHEKPPPDNDHVYGAYVDPFLLHRILELFNWSYGPFSHFGGVAGWEYSRSHTISVTGAGGEVLTRGGYDRPWEWGKLMRAVLNHVFLPKEMVSR